jgi:parallel beta-helix repeat protein
MRFYRPVRLGWMFAFVWIGLSARASAQNGAVLPGSLRSYSTMSSVGLEWDVSGDDNHDATAALDYRRTGTSTWQQALPLVRIDYNGRNTLAGSALFLAPDTSYDFRIALADRDGGSQSRQVTVRTRPVPVAPATGRIFHVVAGNGGGNGSEAAPFGGVAAAETVALPGDTFLLHAGAYGGRIRFVKSGTTTNYIAWKAAGDGDVLMNGVDVSASSVWLEGVTIRNQSYGLLSFNSPANVVVTRCTFSNNHYGIYLQGAGTNWYVADNTISGDTAATSGSLDGEGIDLHITSGHTLAHNRISNVADGISYPGINVDIAGNDIFNTSDDGIEADNGGANVRMWANRIHNAVHNGISFQPQLGGPWYIVRNQIVGNVEAAFKFRTTDRFVLLHNTIVNWVRPGPARA